MPNIAADAESAVAGHQVAGTTGQTTATVWAVTPIEYTDLQVVTNIPQSYWPWDLTDGLAAGVSQPLLVADAGTFANGGTAVAYLPEDPGFWAVAADCGGTPVILATNPVPEPVSLSLLTLGAFGLAVLRQRRRRNASVTCE